MLKERDERGAYILGTQPSTAQMLRAALVGLVGVDGRDELEAMELVIRFSPAPAADKAATIDAIHALISTLPNGTPTFDAVPVPTDDK